MCFRGCRECLGWRGWPPRSQDVARAGGGDEVSFGFLKGDRHPASTGLEESGARERRGFTARADPVRGNALRRNPGNAPRNSRASAGPEPPGFSRMPASAGGVASHSLRPQPRATTRLSVFFPAGRRGHRDPSASPADSVPRNVEGERSGQGGRPPAERPLPTDARNLRARRPLLRAGVRGHYPRAARSCPALVIVPFPARSTRFPGPPRGGCTSAPARTAGRRGG